VFDNDAQVFLDGVGFITKNDEGGMYRLLKKMEEAEREMATAKSYEGKALAKMSGDYNDGRPSIPKNLMNRAVEIAETRGVEKAISVTGISRSSLMRERAKRKNNLQNPS
jgi:hypothetical protein